jgi:hypothetical protein
MNNKELGSLCPVLKVLLDHELERGNQVIAVETGWSRVKLVVRLSGPLDMPFIQKARANNPDLEIWENRDIKNPRETGVLCKSAQQSLSGMLPGPDQC